MALGKLYLVHKTVIYLCVSVPLSVICAFPYILAFSTDAIEFRYAVNGSLLQTLCMPELKLISAKVSLVSKA